MASPDLEAVSVQLHVIADTIERERARVASIVEPFLGTDREDVIAAVLEAERQLGVASRSLQRAIRNLRP